MTDRFDELARAVAETEEVGRRKLLRRALTALGIGAGAVVLGERPALAGKPVNCPPGMSNCGGLCRDTSSHSNHCGACGTVCGNDSVCRDGVCVKVACDCGTPGCPSTQTSCGGVCVNTATDSTNCGACGYRCPAGQTCQSGACQSAGCPSGQTLCDGVCVNLATDESNCGACGAPCQVLNGVPSCQNGTCAIAACNAGFADCDSNPANGCETNVMSSATNCGACGNVCPSGAVCHNGTCVQTCTPRTCAQAGAQCGTIGDGCGGFINCGSCAAPGVCRNNVCA